jgi:ABC-type lipoprotein release transport system permease subunit
MSPNTKNIKTYKIHSALHSETRSGDCWTYDYFNSRLLSILNVNNNKEIIVSNRYIDKNFEFIYNNKPRNNLSKLENSLVLDSYYRKKLLINNNETVDLTITSVKSIRIDKQLKYLYQHPNDSIRISFWLAFIAIIITIIPFIVELICTCMSISSNPKCKTK